MVIHSGNFRFYPKDCLPRYISHIGRTLYLQVINSFVIPNIKMIGERVKMATEGPVMNNADRIAADNIKKIAAVSILQ